MHHAGFTREYVRPRAKRPEPSFRAALMRVLKARLTKETAFFSVPDTDAASPVHGAMGGVPDLVLVHRGKAFGLELKSRNGHLSDRQRAAQLVLREAGMRIEVARDLDEALMHLRDMGIPLKLKSEDAFGRGRAA